MYSPDRDLSSRNGGGREGPVSSASHLVSFFADESGGPGLELWIMLGVVIALVFATLSFTQTCRVIRRGVLDIWSVSRWTETHSQEFPYIIPDDGRDCIVGRRRHTISTDVPAFRDARRGVLSYHRRGYPTHMMQEVCAAMKRSPLMDYHQEVPELRPGVELAMPLFWQCGFFLERVFTSMRCFWRSPVQAVRTSIEKLKKDSGTQLCSKISLELWSIAFV